jgi:hypothetical protein
VRTAVQQPDAFRECRRALGTGWEIGRTWIGFGREEEAEEGGERRMDKPQQRRNEENGIVRIMEWAKRKDKMGICNLGMRKR